MCGRSGIGPQEQLREKGIPVVRDMPAVGNFLVSIDLSP